MLCFCEKSPLNCLVRKTSSLNPIKMVIEPEKSSIRFRGLADKLYALKAVASNVADNAKNQFDDLLKIAKYEKNDAFVKLDYKNDRLESFLSNFLTTNDFKDLWHVCKIIFVLSHGQSDIEREFSVNKEIFQDNLQEKSVSQRLIYDTMHSTEQQLYDFTISPALYRSCKSAYSNYKIALGKVKEDKEKNKKSLKRKTQEDELQDVKRQKSIIVDAIDTLRKGLILETQNADQKQDMSLCTGIEEKEKQLEECSARISPLEDILKQQ